VTQFDSLLQREAPWLALAPMQDVTDGAFWKLMHRYGGADIYWTEYFRVHAVSRPEKWILESIEQNSTGRPVVAQMIGNESFTRNAPGADSCANRNGLTPSSARCVRR